MSQTTKASALLHEWFNDEDHYYSEYEPSDIEYFIAVMLYNQFQFKLAVKTMLVMDIGSDFIEACEEKIYETRELLSSIKFDTDEEAVEMLLEYIHAAQAHYPKSECYLLDRIENHILLLKDRYKTQSMPEEVVFEKKTKSTYPF